MTTPGSRRASGRPTLLLPWYLGSEFQDLFTALDFRVLWDETREGVRTQLERESPDLAMEWQHGDRDFPVRDLLRECGRTAALFLCLNWRSRPPSDFRELGYIGWLRGPFGLVPTLRLFRDVLGEEKERWIDGAITQVEKSRARNFLRS